AARRPRGRIRREAGRTTRGSGQRRRRRNPAAERPERGSALLLGEEVLELRVVDLDVRVAAELLDVLVEALVVEILADPLLQVVGHVGERLYPPGLSSPHWEKWV